jgi:hypothetical protein
VQHYLSVIPLFVTQTLILSPYLTSQEQRPPPVVVFSLMYSTLVPEDGQSNRPKHVVEI